MKFLLLFLMALRAQAYYPANMLNQNVCDEIKDQRDRLIPKTDWFCGAVDGQGFARLMGNEDYYHGVGHWTQARTEISWAPNVAINMRSIFFSGSSSEGYANPTGQYNLVSFKFAWPERILGGTFSGRVVDLDRQTVGVGLFVQDKETNGGILKWDFDHSEILLRQESTGWFMLADDVTNVELRTLNKKIGAGTLYFWSGDDQTGTQKPKHRDPYHYLFTSFHLSELQVDGEVGVRNNALASLIALKQEFYFWGFTLNSKVEGRTYRNGFAEDIAGEIQHQYVSYDQYNKAYTNSMNIFAQDDNVLVYAGVLDLTYEWNHFHRAGFFNELARFDYRDLDPEFRYFFRLEYDFYPFAAREDHFEFYVSNKLFSQSTSYFIPPRGRADVSEPLFRQFTHVGIDGKFRF